MPDHDEDGVGRKCSVYDGAPEVALEGSAAHESELCPVG